MLHTFKIYDKENNENKEDEILLYIDKINSFKIISEENSKYILGIIYRIKASQKIVESTINLNKNELSKLMMQNKIFRLNSYFINTKTIQFIEKEKVSKNLINLRIHFIDGTYLILNKIEEKKWEEWSKVRL